MTSSSDKTRIALENGSLPTRISEGFRIINAPSTQTKSFQRIMTSMAEEILGAKQARRLGIRFYLTDEPYLNAGKFKYARPPIIIFSRKLIEAFKPENLEKLRIELHAKGISVPAELFQNSKGMLIGILAHELQHIQLGDSNSKGIEAACDNYAVERLIELGYRKESLAEALSYVVTNPEESSEASFGALQEYLDIHPRTDNRIRMMENKFFQEIEGKGRVGLDKTGKLSVAKAVALPNAIFDTTTSAYRSRFEQMLDRHHYDQQKTVAAKLKVLHNIILTEAPTWDAWDHGPRVKELIAKFNELNVAKSRFPDDGPEKKELDRIADTLMGIGQQRPASQWYNDGIYKTIGQIWYEKSRLFRSLPLGTYELFAKQIDDFVHAERPQEAKAAALEIEKMGLSDISPNQNIKVLLPGFANPDEHQVLDVGQAIYDHTKLVAGVDEIDNGTSSKYGIKPSWHKHVEWALKETDQERPITKVLNKLGVNHTLDPRLQLLTEPMKSNYRAINSVPNDLIVSANGLLIGLRPDNNYRADQHLESKIAKNAARIEQRKREKLDPAQLDWSMVRSGKNFHLNNFVKKHLHELTPDVLSKGNATLFERRFIGEVENTLRRIEGDDVGYYKGAIRVFLASRLPSSIASVVEGHAVAFPIAQDHPYIKFMQRHPHGILTLQNKAKLCALTLDSAFRSDKDQKSCVVKNIAFLRKTLGYKEPHTVPELFAALDYLNQHTESDNNSKLSILTNIADYEVERVMRANPSATLSAAQLASLYDLGEKAYGIRLKEPYEELLSHYVNKHCRQELHAPAAELVVAYNTHHQSAFFKQRVELRSQYEQAIMQTVGAIADTEKKQELLAQLLLSNTGGRNYTRYFEYRDDDTQEQPRKFLANPEFREWAINSWVECAARNIAAKVGTPEIFDANNPAYLKEACTLVDDVLKRTDGITRHAMLTRFLDRVEAQRNLSYYVRDRLNDVAFSEIAALHYQAAAGEVFLDHLAFDPSLRKRTIEFLKAPCDEAAAKKYARALRYSAEETAYNTKVSGVPLLIKKALIDALKKSELYDESEVVATYAAHMLHKNFASSSPEYRTFMMEKILFPPNQQARPMDVDPQTYVFNQTLPEQDAYSKYGRSLLSNYLSALRSDEEYVKRMYLSALLVAEEPGSNEKNPQKRIGKAIHALLNSMDNPLACKTSQAIDSTPGIPDWLRNPVSKSGSNIPPRWVIHEMFEQDASRDVKATTKRIGKVRAGAVGIAVELDKDTTTMRAHGYSDSAPRTVFKMVRKGAASKVTLHAPRVQQMIDASIHEYPELKPAKSIIEHAILASQVETDFRNAPLQSKIAKRLTDGMRVSAGGKTFTLREVPILQANQFSHEMAWAPGTMFNELPKDQKPAAAEALFTAENYLTLSGFQVDWDRHGAQAMVDGNTIYLLDRGGMMLEPPTKQDKQLLGHTLAVALNDYVVHGTPFADAFSRAIDATSDVNGKINHYLATVARGQHNLGDLRREIPLEHQMRSLMAVFQTKNIDPIIALSAFNALDPAAKAWLESHQKELPSGGQAIRIDDPNVHRRAGLFSLQHISSFAKRFMPTTERKLEEGRQGWLSQLIHKERKNPADTLHRPAYGSRPSRGAHTSGNPHPFVSQLPGGRFGQAADSKGGAEYRA